MDVDTRWPSGVGQASPDTVEHPESKIDIDMDVPPSLPQRMGRRRVRSRADRVRSRPRKSKAAPPVEMKTGEELRAAIMAVAMGAAVFLEIFSGSARLSSCMTSVGIAAIGVDILQGYDLLRADIEAVIGELIKGGFIAGIWLATPCQGLGRARRGTPWKKRLAKGTQKGFPAAIRGRGHEWGLPVEELCPRDRQTLAQSNALIRFSLRIIEAAVSAGVPVAMENPAKSYLWTLPEVGAMLEAKGCARVTLDFCGYGTPWQKSTTLLFRGWTGVGSLSKRCRAVRCGKGVPCLCGFSFKPHQHLSGICREEKTWWTSVAEPYPWPLAQAIADVFRAMRGLFP